MKEAEDEVNSGGCLGVHRDIYQRYSLRFQTKFWYRLYWRCFRSRVCEGLHAKRPNVDPMNYVPEDTYPTPQKGTPIL